MIPLRSASALSVLSSKSVANRRVWRLIEAGQGPGFDIVPLFAAVCVPNATAFVF